MNSIDIRNANWEAIQEYLTANRAEVLAAWRLHGPGTTREIAAKAGIDILSFRPRTTELVHIHMVAMVDRRGTQGIYEAVSEENAERAFDQAKAAALAISAEAPAVFGLRDPEAGEE